ncbi:MAG: mRNA cap guanine-N7 methyltransferase [Alyxoria varia]|nr:MAG: mRNA cap guanine-N7 methyltransferase [Alyxoria varia]
MYDPARDTFTNDHKTTSESPTETHKPAQSKPADPAETEETPPKDGTNKVKTTHPPTALSQDGDSHKRKRDTNETTPKPGDSSSATPKASQTQDPMKHHAEPDAKKFKPSPSLAPPQSAGNENEEPKIPTAADIAKLPKARKAAPTDAKELPKTGVSRRGRKANTEFVSKFDDRRGPRSPPKARSPSPIARSPSRSPPRPRKRPGAASRVSVPDAKRRQLEGGKESDQVKQHYNAVPEHDRKWRGTESKIKGLRSFNNWVKSAIIQKFSPNEDFSRLQAQGGGRYYDNKSSNRRDTSQNDQGLLVLDVGCGKGGDLEKWKNAPQRVDLYVGVDPADVSVDQARGRYGSMPRFARGRRVFDANFLVKDCFSAWLGEIPIIQKVGIDPSVGPDGFNPPVPKAGGFDVVTMMFVLHYAFESEEKARMMLRNVAGSLKAGGRFLGAIPNSDVLSSRVRNHSAVTGKKNSKEKGVSDYPPELDANASAPRAGGDALNYDDDDGGQEASDDDWDPEKPSDPQQKQAAAPADSDSDDDWDPEKPSDPQQANEILSSSPTNTTGDNNTTAEKTTNATNIPAGQPLTWGNSIYDISFADGSILPRDGVFRPSFGWKYTFDLKEAVSGVPEYVVPWEAFRALALEYDLELQYKKPFGEVWREERDERELRELARRMNVLDKETGEFRVSREEWEATAFYLAFCFTKL